MRISCILLRTGNLVAHQLNCLMLLGSPPDMVHSRQSHKTHSSSQPATTQTTQVLPSFRESTPAIAGCRYRAPLPPRLVWPYFTSYFTCNHPYIITQSLQDCKSICRNSFFVFKYCFRTHCRRPVLPQLPAVCCTFPFFRCGRERRF